MINGQPDTIIKALQAYQNETGSDELINNLGVMRGKIVRLADHPDDSINLSKTLQKELQRIQLQPKINNTAGTRLSEYTDKHALTDNPKLSTNITCKALTEYTRERTKVKPEQIQNRLKDFKLKHKRQLEHIEKCTRSYWTDNTCRTYDNEVPPEKYIFDNTYTTDKWTFTVNKKFGGVDKKELFMSTVICYQFEELFKRNNYPLTLPKIITRKRIDNNDTIRILIAHRNDYKTQSFEDDFLKKTVNGQSTVHVAKELGMQIDGLTVYYQEKEVTSLIMEEDGFIKLNELKFSVNVHVSPDPDVYGSPQ